MLEVLVPLERLMAPVRATIIAAVERWSWAIAIRPRINIRGRVDDRAWVHVGIWVSGASHHNGAANRHADRNTSVRLFGRCERQSQSQSERREQTFLEHFPTAAFKKRTRNNEKSRGAGSGRKNFMKRCAVTFGK